MILNKKYARLLEVRCGLLQGMEARNINMPAEKSINISSEIPEQGLVKKDDNKDDDTEEVEETDMKYQDDIDNYNVNINCKEIGIVVKVNEVNKVNVNNNNETIEVVEE